ncbi:SDR family NAD(P)-dependent oxidoreductase, partial [Klebsiella quasipneumoniae]|uniref:SDR family NAD(P)-dependent oxidoreductase n=1 Tax=Klebsiella quasipneumoniae TaxID=1463165 RepID=UPI0021588D04
NGGKNSLNRLIRCVCGKKIGPDPRNFNQRVSLGRNDLLIRTFPNVRGPMLQLAALSGSLNSGASVLVTSSSSVYEGAAMTSLYAATKGAVVAMVKSWASALAVRGIRANTLVPGPIETNYRHFMPEESRQQFENFVVSQVPLGRAGTPEEASAVALFLLSDDASYVTGSQYAVDGGLVHY